MFVYLREVYGPAVAFLFGWKYFVGPTGIAAVAVVFAEYLGRLVGLSPVGVGFAAAGAIVIVAAASYRSVRRARPMKGAATLVRPDRGSLAHPTEENRRRRIQRGQARSEAGANGLFVGEFHDSSHDSLSRPCTVRRSKSLSYLDG